MISDVLVYFCKEPWALSDAGIITTNKKFNNKKSIRNYGEDLFVNYEKRKYINNYKGLNSRMSEIVQYYLLN